MGVKATLLREKTMRVLDGHHHTIVAIFLVLCAVGVASSQSWKPVESPYDTLGHGLSVIAVATGPQGYLYCAASQIIIGDQYDPVTNIYQSTDGGASWTALCTPFQIPTALSLTVLRTGSIIAGCVNSIWRYDYSSRSWTSVFTFQGLPNTSGGGVFLTMVSGADSSVFAATNDYVVFRSTDDGRNWTRVLPDSKFRAFFLASNGHGLVVAANFEGVINFSLDNGDNWTVGSQDTNGISSVAIDATGSIYLGNGNGVERSDDWGTTWISCNNVIGDTIRNTGAKVWSILTSASGTVFVGTGYRGASVGMGIFRSSDKGNTWEHLRLKQLQNKEIRTLCEDSSHAIVAGLGGGVQTDLRDGGLLRSTDGGTSWNQINGHLSTVSGSRLLFNSRGDAILTADYHGVFLAGSNQTGSWTPQNEGLPFGCSSGNGQTISCVVDNGKGTLYAGTGCGLYRASTSVLHWEKVSDSLPVSLVSCLYSDSTGVVLAQTYSKGVFRSADDGMSWLRIDSAFRNGRVNVFAGDKHGHIFAGTESSLFRSDDEGASWRAVNNGLDDSLPRQFHNADSTTNQNLFATAHIYVIASRSEGVVFARGTSLFSEFIPPSGMGDGYEAVTVVDRVYKSTDSGDHWMRAGLDSQAIAAIVIDSEGAIYAGYGFSYLHDRIGGVRYSKNSGSSWDTLNAGLPMRMSNEIVQIKDLEVDPAGKLWAVTTYGLFAFSTATGVSERESGTAIVSMPDAWIVSITPNPVSEELNIRYKLGQETEAKLELYSVLGTRVTSLKGSSFQDAGDHEITASLSNVPAGYYFCRLTTRHNQSVRPVVIVH